MAERNRGGSVVVGHDGSAHSDAALTQGLLLAEAFGATLLVIRAWPLEVQTPGSTSILAPPTSVADLTASARADLIRGCEPIVRAHPTVAVSFQATVGAPADVLTSLSRNERLLVVGSRGLGGLTGLLLGSVADRCLHQASCPVLIVRPEHEDATPPSTDEDGDRSKDSPRLMPGSVVVGHDGSISGMHAVAIAFEYAEALHAPLAVVRCWNSDHMPPGLLWRDGYVASFDEAFATIEQHLRTTVAPTAAAHPDVESTYYGPYGDAAETLVRVAKHAALLVLGSRGRGGFSSLLLGSVSTQCAHRAACPTLVVPQHTPV